MGFQKKYSVFISSTYEDLKEEREAVMSTLLRHGFFVSGMEIFPASCLKQFEYIKRTMDDCDYFVLIICGKLGTICEDTNISYTEIEFKYALENNMPIHIFYYDPIKSLLKKKRESDTERQRLFNEFRNIALKDKLAKPWKNIDELQFWVLDSLMSARAHVKRDGWVRGNVIAKSLREREKRRKALVMQNFDYKVHIHYKDHRPTRLDEKTIFNSEFWKIFFPILRDFTKYDTIQEIIEEKFLKKEKQDPDFIEVDHPTYSEIFHADFEPFLVRTLIGNDMYVKLTEEGFAEISKYLYGSVVTVG